MRKWEYKTFRLHGKAYMKWKEWKEWKLNQLAEEKVGEHSIWRSGKPLHPDTPRTTSEPSPPGIELLDIHPYHRPHLFPFDLAESLTPEETETYESFIDAILNRQGQEGWELVSHQEVSGQVWTGVVESPHDTYYFKREIIEEK